MKIYVRWKPLINDTLIDYFQTIPERVDVFVDWLTTDTSLIDPSHLSVSVDELLSEHSLLMLPVLLEMLLVLPLRFGDWKSCDQLMARDCSSWLSWRNLYSNVFFASADETPEMERKKYTSKTINNHYLFIIYVCFCHESRQLNIRRNNYKMETFKSSKLMNER